MRQKIDKQQTSCLKVTHCINNNMLSKQLNKSFAKELETKDRPLRKGHLTHKQHIVEHELKQILKLICAVRYRVYI